MSHCQRCKADATINDKKWCDVIDVIFVLDESETVLQQDPTNFETLKSFMTNLTGLFTISQVNSRVAAIGYGRNAATHFHFFESLSQTDLNKRIDSMKFIGGSRNTAAGFQTAFQEIVSYSRISMGGPVYLIQISEYAHDIGTDPVMLARNIGALNIPIFSISVLAFENDPIFQSETQQIVNAGAPGSMQFNATTYKDLATSGIVEKFQTILSGFPCTGAHEN